MQRSFLLVASLLLAFGSPLNLLLATDYFVINNGAATGGVGTAADPFGTITEALTSGTPVAGDRILVAAGTYDTAGGEAFPLTLLDGVDLIGAAGNTTIIDAVGAGTDAITGSNLTSATILDGFTILPDDTYDALDLWASTALNLTLQNNVVDGGAQTGNNQGADDGFRLFFTSATSVNLFILDNFFRNLDETAIYVNGGNISGTVQVNASGNSASGVSDMIDFYIAGSGTANVTLNGNQAAWLDSAAYELDFWASTGQTMDVAVVVRENVARYCDDDGFDINFSAGTGGVLSGTLAVLDNSAFKIDDTCYELDLGAWSTSALVSITATYSGNMAQLSLDDEGYSFYISAPATNASAFLTLDFQCNTAMMCEEEGFEMEVWASTNASASAVVTLHFNEFLGNFGDGMDLYVYGSFGFAALHMDAAGNTIRDNAELGIDIGSSSNAGTAILDLDFGGGGALAAGRNTIQDNVRFGDPFDAQVEISASDNAPTVDFEGNWWGTTVLAEVEDLIFHDPDSAGVGTVNFAGPLADPLVFGVPAAVLSAGLAVNVAAGADTLFVAKAGKSELTLTIGGVTAVVTAVAADGSALTFTMPFGVPGGSQALVITNPGGQKGTLVVVVAGASSNSGCFVATAAFGDYAAPEVVLLQRWRDECLSDNAVGRQLVKAYYALSPALADRIANSSTARTVSRVALTPVAGAVRLWLELPWLYAAAGGLLLWRLLRRRA